MKREEKAKLRALSSKELLRLLEEKKKQLLEARFKLVRGELKNVRFPGKIRHEIAVIKTILAEKEKEGKNG